MLQKTLFAPPQFVAFPVWYGQIGFFLLHDAVPKIFYELKALGSPEFEEL